jgi:hypothetical protein
VHPSFSHSGAASGSGGAGASEGKAARPGSWRYEGGKTRLVSHRLRLLNAAWSESQVQQMSLPRPTAD